MKKSQIDWIFFDLDDTLIPSSKIYEECYRKLGLIKNTSFDLAKKEVKQILPPNHTSSHNRFLYFKRMLEIDKNFSPKNLLRINTTYESVLKTRIHYHLKRSSIQKNLEKLSEKYNLAIVTNEICRTQILKINAIDPNFKYFSLVITSEDAGAEKPEFKIFDIALKRANTKPNRVLFVGDSYNCDIVPAKKLGMKAVQTFQFVKGAKNKNIRSINSLEDLFTLA